MKRGKFRISHKQLREFLNLNDNVEILNITHNFNNGFFEIIFRENSLEDMPEGYEVMTFDLKDFQKEMGYGRKI